jgi:hypothetical protein
MVIPTDALKEVCSLPETSRLLNPLASFVAYL